MATVPAAVRRGRASGTDAATPSPELRTGAVFDKVRAGEFMKPVGKFQGLDRAIGIGSEMVAATAVGAAIGWWLDNLTGWSPWCLVIFFVLGSVAGFFAVYRGMQRWQEPPQ